MTLILDIFPSCTLPANDALCFLKGWDPKEQDMSQVVAIHNTVNERTWQHILAWEMLHACECSSPRLKRFQGKPNEYSPKARLLNFLVRQMARASWFQRSADAMKADCMT
jgi:hypothetical protein